MPPEPSSRRTNPPEGVATAPSMRDIAAFLGLSVATVSRAMREDAAVRPETRERVAAAAAAIGYRRNTLVGNFMSSIRRGASSHFKGNLALLWGGKSDTRDHRLTQIRAGVSQRAAALGYSLGEFDLSAHPTRSVARILQSRGITGVLIAVPSFASGKVYLRFDFSRFSCVSLGWGLFRPQLHTVRFDYFQAIRLALHHTRHPFGGRVAALWDVTTDLRSHRAAQASFMIHHPDGPVRAQKLFLNSRTLTREAVRRHRVECLLVAAGVPLPAWAAESLQIVHFRHPAEERCFAWIDTQNNLMGRWGVDVLASQLAANERGIPEACQVMLVPPRWCKNE